ncbi:isochorismate-pyruvate lyase [Mariniphaga sediminis]|uniref:chorismate mutase n=2 Tax=Mariniphaga sediminis TaxID=1628158 RepID=A0A399D433_9BACT|nr:isochorismate-pyruvate lyase [Mariniphaga sediminis]
MFEDMDLKKPQDCSSAGDIRDEIDKIDKQIIVLFSERHKYIEEIVRFKQDEESIEARDRKEQVIEQRKEWAENHGLDAEVFKEIYTLLIESNIKHELKILKSKTTNNQHV